MRTAVRAALLAGPILLAISLSSPPRANAYQVTICDQTASTGITVGTPSPGFTAFNRCGEPSGGFISQVVFVESPSASQHQGWSIQATPATRLEEVELTREVPEVPSKMSRNIRWSAAADLGTIDHVFLNSAPSTETKSYTLKPAEGGASSFDVDLKCAVEPCKAPAVVIVRDITAEVDDREAPTVTLDDSVGTQPLRGTVELPFVAVDRGSGIERMRVGVDGVLRQLTIFNDDGRCSRPFKFLVPCPLRVESAISLNTVGLGLSEGEHKLEVIVNDASGGRHEIAPLTIVVRNAPSATERPRIDGPAELGATLTASPGTWEGQPTAFSYQWLRCPTAAKTGAESGCEPIPGATRPHHVADALDLGRLLAVKVTTENSFGAGVGFSATSSPILDKLPPLLGSVSLSRKRFRVGKAATALAAKNGGRGTVLTFSSTEAGKLSLVIASRRTGKKVSTLTRTIAAGSGRVALSGRIKRKPLKPGSYKITATATDPAGNASQPASVAFKILRD